MRAMLTRVLLIAVPVVALTGVLLYSQSARDGLKVSGFIEADEIRLGSRVGGRVHQVLVEEGQTVRAGEALIKLEPYDLLEQQQEAASQLAQRQAELDRLEAGFRPEEARQAEARHAQLAARLELLKNGPRQQEIDAATSRVRIAEAELELARQNFQRVQSLRESRAVSEEEYDAAEKELQSARNTVVVRTKELEDLELGTREEEIAEAEAKLREAEAAWDLIKHGFRQEEIAAARAARDAAKAKLAALGERIEELVIKTPVDGTIEALELQPGDLVSPSAPVLSIMDTSNLWVRAYVPEDRLGLTPVGNKLPVTVDSYPGVEFPGKVTFVSRQGEFTPSNVQTPEERSKQVFRFKVTLLEGLDKLRPGMAADVWLD